MSPHAQSPASLELSKTLLNIFSSFSHKAWALSFHTAPHGTAHLSRDWTVGFTGIGLRQQNWMVLGILSSEGSPAWTGSKIYCIFSMWAPAHSHHVFPSHCSFIAQVYQAVLVSVPDVHTHVMCLLFGKEQWGSCQAGYNPLAQDTPCSCSWPPSTRYKQWVHAAPLSP